GEDRLQQLERREDVLAGYRLRRVGASRREGGLDRPVLALVERVQLVDGLVPRRPDGRAGERPPRALRHLLDERQPRDAIDHVVEAMIGAHPLRRERAPVAAGLAGTQRARKAREELLGVLELLEVFLRDLRRGDAGYERLELRADHERLAHALAGERADTYSSIRLEGDEAERRKPPERLAHGGAADRVPLRELLLAQDRPRRELAC